ncbi:hypothetical protein CaCOL14_010454 [Colletotrichum acutatum]|uniref:Uncharacterized protein n=1 Tax=Glomerella acutata TaxID=27357 RepID=A0AAD8UDZ3_GLOAC|nr:uncharacterized protein BDZ83DRAFT_585985 [Colletotrichum acutatum]KAK1718183.1 hypothetical protein BDZ83DRAFT_585985 [Colletotrichum acutatum]
MQISTLSVAAAVFQSFVKAAYPPNSLGTFAYSHGNQLVTENPSTQTTAQELVELCNSSGAIQGIATCTAICVANTYVFGLICRKPFSFTDDFTNRTYANLEPACVGDIIGILLEPDVTAVVYRNTKRPSRHLVLS